jgi:rare lipoprotein A
MTRSAVMLVWAGALKTQMQNLMKTVLILVLFASIASSAVGAGRPTVASWYGEDHRGRLMANGKPFDPDKLTAASWFYPLGTKVRVTLKSPYYLNAVPPSVLVTITDRGPARRLVRQGRKIDLAAAAFKQLAHPDLGLVEVTIAPERSGQM